MASERQARKAQIEKRPVKIGMIKVWRARMRQTATAMMIIQDRDRSVLRSTYRQHTQVDRDDC